MLKELKDQNRAPMLFLMGLACLGGVVIIISSISRGAGYLALSIAIIPGLLLLVWGFKRFIDAASPIAVKTDDAGVAVAYPYSVVYANWSDFDPRIRGPIQQNPTRVTLRFRTPPGGGVQPYGLLTQSVLYGSRGSVEWVFPSDFAVAAGSEF